MKQIYVHGLGQTSDSWTKTIDILQTTDYSLCPNLPDLVHSKEVTYDNLYAAFSDYCNQYDEPIDLCGLSLGGVLALNYAIQYPKKVRSLVLIQKGIPMFKPRVQPRKEKVTLESDTFADVEKGDSTLRSE